jgi:hypothetical protein
LNTVAGHERTCALRAPTAFLARIKDIRARNAVSVNNRESMGFVFKIADPARMVFIRAESAIRADGVRPRKALHGRPVAAHTISRATIDLARRARDLSRDVRFLHPQECLVPS